MDRFVPLDKKSKKEQKKFHARQRKTWEGISPVTRTVPNGKAYNRKKLKADVRRSSSDFRNEKNCCFVILGQIAHFTASVHAGMMFSERGKRSCSSVRKTGYI